jgi:hypothetical protein
MSDEIWCGWLASWILEAFEYRTLPRRDVYSYLGGWCQSLPLG